MAISGLALFASAVPLVGFQIGNKYELRSRAELHIVSRRGEDGSPICPMSHRDRKMRNSDHLSRHHGARSFGATRLEVDGRRRLADTPHIGVQGETYH